VAQKEQNGTILYAVNLAKDNSLEQALLMVRSHHPQKWLTLLKENSKNFKS
jgi:hypothetical protein